MSYDNTGKVSLWKKDDDAKESAPLLKGPVYAHRDIAKGEKLDLSLWKNDSDNPDAPLLTGKLADPYKRPDGNQDASRQEAPEQQKDFADDDIPF